MSKTNGEKNMHGEQQKWFVKEDLQDLAKIGGDFLKKAMASGIDVLKEVKENFPKEAGHLISKGKEELMRSLSQETAKNLITFTVEKMFKLASEYRLEFSLSIKKKDEEIIEENKPLIKKSVRKKTRKK